MYSGSNASDMFSILEVQPPQLYTLPPRDQTGQTTTFYGHPIEYGRGVCSVRETWYIPDYSFHFSHHPRLLFLGQFC